MKHRNKYSFFEVSQDLINFLRGDGPYEHDKRDFDKQIYSHYGESKKHSDKYIGIIVELQNDKYFAPLTHDGNKLWENRDDTCDFEKIYDDLNVYRGCILLCKALPLTNNLVKFKSLADISNEEGRGYARMCFNELKYLNEVVHDKIQDKMQKCIYNYETSCKNFRVDYQLVIKNVAEYNAMLVEQKEKEIKRLKELNK